MESKAHLAAEKLLKQDEDLASTALLQKFKRVREMTESLCEPLEIEDYVVQPRAEVSPPKWHLAHTSWFFENFILKRWQPGWKPFCSTYHHLFNSYYKSEGSHWAQPERGCLSRPTVKEIKAYRAHVNSAMEALLASEHKPNALIGELTETGIHHEQQHQELLLMDIKVILAANPSLPAYRKGTRSKSPYIDAKFLEFAGGTCGFGINREDGFSFCNETPRHQRHIDPFQLCNRPITNGEYKNFIEDGGYENPLLWKSDGWNWVQANHIEAPLYWFKQNGEWHLYDLHGAQRIDENAPVAHVSYYEADAFAEWSGARLPSEFELELAYKQYATNTNGFYNKTVLTPALFEENDMYSLTGNLWEWSASPYAAYPRYRRPQGALGEYNQKFMINQIVLRGGSFATPKDHFRVSYRNFFYPQQRWAFTGLRLARDTQC